MADLRVIGIMHTWTNKNNEPEEELIQYLQKRCKRKHTFFGLLPKFYWETIDLKIVPSFAWIHKCIFGDESNWKSKWNGIPNIDWIKK